ncbi:MAG: L-glutamate gamma-semialdehyde dehydrogenase [Melioribacteraceae bacterium]|jgi:1-pyrroline-5-carboxylate dehydrogenase|nr:L-glutamate gamma-semialdehyde dehydrogenase [Melioribacteraceae bacterium]
MSNGIFSVPFPDNDPIRNYEPGSRDKEILKKRMQELKSEVLDIPIIIGGKEIRTGNTATCVVPHKHSHILANYHKAGKEEVNLAIEAALAARDAWAEMPWKERAAIFLKAADLLTTDYWRSTLNAATMLGQSKTAFQAEIDAACELVDFFRFNAYYAQQIYEEQPMYSPEGQWNRMEYRPLEGFVFAVAPFNFTSIAGNLPTSPALMGNVVIMKPASSAVYSGYWLMKLFIEAGVPDGVINFVPGSGSQVGNPVLESPDLAGIHFTGSTPVFQGMWKTIGEKISKYKGYPRIVGETGGKDFVFVHKSADVDVVATAIVRGAFEFQGQKCSAASRGYIPKSMWNELKGKVVSRLETVKMGDPEDFTNFVNAVIDKGAFETITGYIDYIKNADNAEIVFGGNYDDSVGYFIEPTFVVTTNPNFKTMEEEIFGPVFTLYVYDDEKYEETLNICNQTSPYALTGAIFAKDRNAVELANKILVNAAGNFYINDKPTGAVVGQQPFGGARASGTNDKAGSYLNLIRWVSPRTIKENFIPPTNYEYPFMEEE